MGLGVFFPPFSLLFYVSTGSGRRMEPGHMCGGRVLVLCCAYMFTWSFLYMLDQFIMDLLVCLLLKIGVLGGFDSWPFLFVSSMLRASYHHLVRSRDPHSPFPDSTLS